MISVAANKSARMREAGSGFDIDRLVCIFEFKIASRRECTRSFVLADKVPLCFVN